MGGNVSAPAPNPALMQAQIDSLNAQGQIGREALTNAEALQPVQRAQMQFGLDAGKTAYEQSQEDRDYALQKRGQYDQAVQGVLNESQKFDEASRRQELQQQAQADISRQYSAAEEQQQRGLERAGVMPGSGKALMSGQQGELAEAEARSRAGLMVTEAAKKEGLQLQGGAAAMLSGFPAQAASLTPTGASLGAGGLGITNAALQGEDTGLGQAGAAEATYGGMAGDMYSQANKLYLGAQTQNQENLSTEIGSGAGLAALGGYKGYTNYNKSGNVLGKKAVGLFGWGD